MASKTMYVWSLYISTMVGMQKYHKNMKWKVYNNDIATYDIKYTISDNKQYVAK